MRAITLITLIPLALVPVSCNENATGPQPEADIVDRLDGLTLFRYGTTYLPVEGIVGLEVEQVLFYTFDDGAFVYKREILTEHPGTRVPAWQWLLYESSGRYWENECTGRTCEYVFEGTSGQIFDIESQSMEVVPGNILTMHVVFGDERIKVESNLYQHAPIAELAAVRFGATKR